MKFTTQRDVIRNVANRWRQQYPQGKAYWPRDSEETYTALVALDKETATPEQIAKIIGNESWTRLRCDECEEDVTALLTVGEEPDYESATASICLSCLEKAASYLPTKKVKEEAL